MKRMKVTRVTITTGREKLLAITWLYSNYYYDTLFIRFLPATLASLHASYMSCLISGLSSAIVSPTVTNLSTAKFTAWPTLATARRLRSEHSGRSLCETNVEICKDRLHLGEGKGRSGNEKNSAKNRSRVNSNLYRS